MKEKYITTRTPKHTKEVLIRCKKGAKEYTCIGMYVEHHTEALTETVFSWDPGIGFQFDNEEKEFYVPEGYYEVLHYGQGSIVPIDGEAIGWAKIPKMKKEKRESRTEAPIADTIPRTKAIQYANEEFDLNYVLLPHAVAWRNFKQLVQKEKFKFSDDLIQKSEIMKIVEMLECMEMDTHTARKRIKRDIYRLPKVNTIILNQAGHNKWD